MWILSRILYMMVVYTLYNQVFSHYSISVMRRKQYPGCLAMRSILENKYHGKESGHDRESYSCFWKMKYGEEPEKLTR